MKPLARRALREGQIRFSLICAHPFDLRANSSTRRWRRSRRCSQRLSGDGKPMPGVASLGKEILPRRSQRFLDADQSGREEANFACFNSLDTSWIQVAQFGQAFLGKPEPGSLTSNRAADLALMRNCLIILTHGSLPHTSLVQGHGGDHKQDLHRFEFEGRVSFSRHWSPAHPYRHEQRQLRDSKVLESC